MSSRTWRWWFENRTTGQITVAQFPNWPLWCIAACWLARLAASDESTLYDLLGWTTRALWLFWGVDELVRGVNPWRRLLGSGVIAWQIAAITTA